LSILNFYSLAGELFRCLGAYGKSKKICFGILECIHWALMRKMISKPEFWNAEFPFTDKRDI